VIKFQAKYGISQTGIAGVLTRAKLNSLYASGEPTPPTPQPIAGTLVGPFSLGMRSAQVTLLQQMLSRDSTIYTGPITGYYGSLTRAAVIKFQAKHGISQTGIAGLLTRAKLNQLYSQ
jgi:peptidoglycan hydrolase-like protein with peptidoglycan-binding domain